MIIQLIYKFNFFFSTKRLFESFLFTEYEMLDTYALTNVKNGSGTHFNETLVGLLRYRDLSFYFLYLGYFLEFKFGRHVARKLVGNFQLYKLISNLKQWNILSGELLIWDVLIMFQSSYCAAVDISSSYITYKNMHIAHKSSYNNYKYMHTQWGTYTHTDIEIYILCRGNIISEIFGMCWNI